MVTETSELRGVIQHGESGLVVQPGDVAGMHAAIRHLLASPSTRQALGSRARQVALERYDVNVYASALASHLAEVASLRDDVARQRTSQVPSQSPLDRIR